MFKYFSAASPVSTIPQNAIDSGATFRCVAQSAREYEMMRADFIDTSSSRLHTICQRDTHTTVERERESE
jgi:hypothetical protein